MKLISRRGLEMVINLVEATFNQFKANNPGKGEKEFLEAYGNKEIVLTKGNDNLVMPKTKNLNVADIMYSII
jgi:hypothetical protein